MEDFDGGRGRGGRLWRGRLWPVGGISIRAVAACLSLLAGALAWAPKASSASAAAQDGWDLFSAPNDVRIGIFVNRVDAISFRDNQFQVDFYLWFRWNNPDINPAETFEIINGRIDQMVDSGSHDYEGGRYMALRIQATVIKEFDLYRYPLDAHTLTIEIEDAQEIKDVAYTVDRASSALSEAFFVPGFVPVSSGFWVVDHDYTTDYGDPDMMGQGASTYSRFIASVDIERPSSTAALKLYIGVFVAALIGFMSLAVPPSVTDARFGLGSAALFAAIATQFVIASNLPDTAVLTIPDTVCIVTIGYVFLTLLESAMSLRLHRRGHEVIARRLDWAVLVGLFASYSLICLGLILV
jgi:hypothetical protein